MPFTLYYRGVTASCGHKNIFRNLFSSFGFDFDCRTDSSSSLQRTILTEALVNAAYRSIIHFKATITDVQFLF